MCSVSTSARPRMARLVASASTTRTHRAKRPVSGVPVVEVEGLLVVGECRDGAAGQALVDDVARVVLEEICSGVNVRSSRSANPIARSAAAACSAPSTSSTMATRKPLGAKTNGRSWRSGSWSVVPTGQTIASSGMAVLRQGAGEGLFDRGGLDAELAGDLAAVDDERLVELVLHLDQLPQDGVDHAQCPEQHRRHGAELAGRAAGVPVHDVDQLAGGAGVGVVGQVPHLTGG